MAREPSVSVVIPLYQKRAFIGRALRSVAAQSVRDFEIIVVDDGSTDGGGDWVRRQRDARVRCLRQENAGVSAARNAGIAAARAELVAFLDADDEYLPGFLETVLRLRRRFPKAGLLATNYALTDRAGRTTPRQQVPGAGPFPWEGVLENFFETAARGRWPIHPSACAAPKAALELVGGFPEGEKSGEDVATWMKIAFSKPVCFSQLVGAHYHAEASTRPPDVEGLLSEVRLLSRTARGLLTSAPARPVPARARVWVRELVIKSRCHAASLLVLSGEKRLAREILLACETRHFRRIKRRWLALSFLPTFVVRTIYRVRERTVRVQGA